MPIPAAVPIVMGIASLFGNLFGAKKTSDAAKKAADTQAQSANHALQLQRDQWTELQRQFAPYTAASTDAMLRLSDMLKRAPSPGVPGSPRLPAVAPTMPTMPTGGGADTTMPLSAFARSMGRGRTPAAAQPGAMVQIQAPDGTVRAVPAHKRDAYLRKGGRVVERGMGQPDAAIMGRR